MLRWVVASGVSGCAWGLLAFVLMDSRTNHAVTAAVAAAPAIGVIMGRLSKGFREGTIARRAWLAVGSLYLAAALFGLVAGIAEALGGTQPAGVQAPAPIWATSLEGMFAIVLGVTASGYVLVLAPLAYANHLLVDTVGWD